MTKEELDASLSASYENPWLLDGVPFESDNIGDSHGFVYLITDLIFLKMYVGRKYFWSTRKVKGKKRRQTTESDWKTYYGSNEGLKRLVLDNDVARFRREILSIHKTRGDTNIAEVRELFARNVLERREYLNENISGKWYEPPAHIVAGRRLSKKSCLHLLHRGI